MKTVIGIILLVAVGVTAFAFMKSSKTQPVSENLHAAAPAAFFDLSYTDIQGKKVSMADYKGKYVLIVNVASKCGHTPQYAKLQELYDKHKDQLVIIGFPCNQFLGQEPGTEKEIEEFCSKNYGVTFPLSSKVDVKGKDQHGVYAWLTNKALNGVGEDAVEWNFHKFLVGKNGEWLASFPAKMDPMNGEIEKWLK